MFSNLAKKAEPTKAATPKGALPFVVLGEGPSLPVRQIGQPKGS